MQRILFVTGKLAEPALRRVIAELAPKATFHPEIAVLPITVAALLTTDWIARHLTIPDQIDRIILPGFCRGELNQLQVEPSIQVELGPKDLRDLPEYFGKQARSATNLDQYDIEILAEVNHAPRLTRSKILEIACHYKEFGANIIDLGCDPGDNWSGVGETVRELVDLGYRVSIDSFDPKEVMAALQAGAELVLSVNSSNRQHALEWVNRFPQIELVAIPDTPTDLDSLVTTAEFLQKHGICHRLDPIVEPIGFGFAASLGRYLEVRNRFPHSEIMMGIGNLTELTDVDTAGMNVILAGFCQELGIRSVLTTEVVNWSRTAVREFDLARKLVFHAVEQRVLPKRLTDQLLMLRDARLIEQGEDRLIELASQVTDRNYRLFAERGEIHIINGSMYLHGTNPYQLFAELCSRDPKMDASHAFYLGFELQKAILALNLGKQYQQDQPLRWGFISNPEPSARQ
jgi:dihydropteroate synthase-like protein